MQNTGQQKTSNQKGYTEMEDEHMKRCITSLRKGKIKQNFDYLKQLLVWLK